MKIVKRFFILFLILTFTLSPLNFQGIFSYFTQAQSTGEAIENIIPWDENKTIENSIIINLSETLIIEKGVTITFKENTSLEVRGKLIAKGTVNDPIKFRGENNDADYSIKIFGSGEVIMRSVDISGGGMYGSWHLIHNSKNLLKKACADQFYWGVISAYNPQKLEMENCSIHGNEAGIQAAGNNVKVNL